MFFALVVLPYLLIGAGLLLLLAKSHRSRSSARALFLYPLICTLLLACGFAAWGHYSIVTSRSSTAPIGYLFLPFYTLAVAAAGFLISWSLLYIVRFANERRQGVPIRPIGTILVVFAVMTLCSSGLFATQWIARHRLLNEAASITTHGLDINEMLDQAVASHDLEVLALLARNPNTSVADLNRIYDSCKDRVSDFNPLEYVVFYAMAQNPKAPPDMLVTLAECQQSTVRLAVGTNPNTPRETLNGLSKDKEQSVRYWMVSNPRIPREILLQLANDPDQLVHRHARQYLSSQADIHP